jgi:chemotaxis methyl-accepting protein methylase
MTIESSKNSVVSMGSKIVRRFVGAYLHQAGRIWNRLPTSFRLLPPGHAYGRHLHALVRFHTERRQWFGTFFLRNRAELELMRRLLDRRPHGSSLDIAVLACSKGAEVYSILWAIRSVRPDLRIRTHAVDVSREILTFAERGLYSLDRTSAVSKAEQRDVTWNTAVHQNAPIFERMTDQELDAMFEVEGDRAKVRSWVKDGITWRHGDACDPDIVSILGPQDIVVANRFLCHMDPGDADRCLRNIARLVKPGGHLFVSGVDLDVRTSVARGMGWKPVTDMIRDIHEGDPSLRRGWPLEYWGVEPLCDTRPDWEIRYASVFQIGDAPLNIREPRSVKMKAMNDS